MNEQIRSSPPSHSPVTVKVEDQQPDLEPQASAAVMQADSQQSVLESKLNELWNLVTQLDKPPIEPEVDDRPVWKTVRIFVSSTLDDFHQEREDLVKKVFAELRIWCEKRLINLIDCDLRWGVPENTPTALALKTCLEEIERCYTDNKAPYFLNLTCKRVGYVPNEEDLSTLSPEFKSEHKVVIGLSMTEMEIVYAAYHVRNPNALFLIRDDSFLIQMQNEMTAFIESDAFREFKLEFLKQRIKDRFEANGQVKKYTCKYLEGKKLYSHCPGEKSRPALELDPSFSENILKFFKEQIEKQYPLTKVKLSEFEEANYHHRAFMESREKMVFGRKGFIDEIIDYTESNETNLPKLVIGEAGTGKSSIMAKAISKFIGLHKGDDNWVVFYHFVGAVPNSASLLLLLRRLLQQIGFGGKLPSTLESALSDVNGVLSRNHGDRRFAIFIDALNQLDLDTQTEAMVGWLPEELSRSVRCVLSMIADTDAHQSLINRKSPAIESFVPQLRVKTREKIVGNYLDQFTKKLDDKQLDVLFAKKASENSLWLKTACEELRVFGEYRAVRKLIEQLPDSLPALLKHVVRRLEKESDEVLLKSTLCLLEVSKAGLLENELRGLLADKENIFYSKQNSGISEVGEKECDGVLPAGEWAPVYHQLKYFLRPYGDSSEGRLDFYHRTLSKVVREMYLSVDRVDGQEEQGMVECQTQRDDDKYKWWHRKLANYFVKCRAQTESLSKPTYMRGVEEYPYHVIELKKLAQTEAERDQYSSELGTFLSDMRTFKELFKREFSEILLRYWREAGDKNYEKMTRAYIDGLRKMEDDSAETEELDELYRFLTRLLLQALKCKEGLELIDKCLELVNKSKDDSIRKEKLIDILSLKADMRIKLMPRTQSPAEIPEIEAIIQVNEEAIRLIEALKDEKDMRFLLAQRLLQTAYARGGIAKRFKMDQDEKKAENLEKSFKEVNEAKRLFKELGDIGQELEAELTLATLYRAKNDKEEQIKIYKNAITRCTSIFGPQHHLLCRLNYNFGVFYEEYEELEEAYGHFLRAYDLAMTIYGPDHESTIKYKVAIDQDQYAGIAAARKK